MAESVSPSLSSPLTRRSLLRNALTATAFATVGVSALSSCSSSKGTTAAGGRARSVALPDYVPFKGPKPQFPSAAPGAPAGFTSYPQDLVTTVKTQPLKGGTVKAMTMIFEPLPTAHAKNAYWKAVEEKVGATIDLTIVPASDYSTKFQTTLASKNFPDLAMLESGVIDDLPSFMEAVCADLTSHLSGTAVKDYPNLAAIPQVVWETCVVADKIAMIPIPRGLTGGSGIYNQTLLDKAGVDYPETAEDFEAATKELTRPQEGHWAIVNMKGNPFFTMIKHMFGVAYNWQLDAGKLVKDIETPEYAEALEFAAKLHSSGVMVPGSDGIDGTARANTFSAGKGAFVYDGLPGYAGYVKGMRDQEPRPFIPMAPKGRKPVTYYDNIAFGTVVLKKAEDARIKEMLSLLNFFAAPFGSTENELMTFGVEGVDFEVDQNGSPVLTDRGTRDLTAPFKYLAAPEQVIFDTNEDYVKNYHSAASELIKIAIKDPAANLISPTNDQKGSDINQEVSDLKNDIIVGRKKMTDWDAAVEKWAKKGGDDIRGEYEAALGGEATPR